MPAAKKSNKMDPIIKKRWITALRSGKYKQGTGQLREMKGAAPTGRYCCLGVLCDITLKETGLVWDKRKFSSYDGTLPRKVARLANLKGREPETGDSVECFLAQANDGDLVGKRWTFKRIATWIEKYL